MTTVTTTQPIPARALQPIPPTAAQVLQFHAVHGYRPVSLLMNTAPAAVMTTPDAATLRRLVRQATQRLGSETLRETPEVLLALDRPATVGPTPAACPSSSPTTRWAVVQRIRSWPYLAHLQVGGFLYDVRTGRTVQLC